MLFILQSHRGLGMDIFQSIKSYEIYSPMLAMDYRLQSNQILTHIYCSDALNSITTSVSLTPCISFPPFYANHAVSSFPFTLLPINVVIYAQTFQQQEPLIGDLNQVFLFMLYGIYQMHRLQSILESMLSHFK